jgi:hypothetical protein
MRSHILASAATAVVFAFGVPAHAGITIFNSPGSVQPAENVLVDGGATAQTVFGHTNTSSTVVTFETLNSGANLQTFANGQARIGAVGGALDGLRFSLSNGEGFSEVEFALHKPTSSTETVNVTFLGSFGSEVRTFKLDNGNSWFSARTDNGDLITSVVFDTNGSGVGDIRQVRVGGFAGSAPAVPEPATWAMMLGGFGLLGAAMRRKSRVRVVYS